MIPMHRLYWDGSVHFVDPRVAHPFSFAHVADLHLAPQPPSLWDASYRPAISWYSEEFRWPDQGLPALLDEISSSNMDFVLFGGDVIDFYHPEPASRVTKLCADRGMRAYFQFGNHDCENTHSRYCTHRFVPEFHAKSSQGLRDLWRMPGSFYSFRHDAVLFLVLDTSRYSKTRYGYEACIDDAQTEWLLDQITYDGPILVFQHVPFNLPSIEYRLRAIWNGILGCVADDLNGRRIKAALGSCANILGVFAAHAHMRSEDALGRNCQFIAPAGHDRMWRHVKIGSDQPPKSMRVAGEPGVAVVL